MCLRTGWISRDYMSAGDCLICGISPEEYGGALSTPPMQHAMHIMEKLKEQVRMMLAERATLLEALAEAENGKWTKADLVLHGGA